MKVSDKVLLEQVLTVENAEAYWRNSPEVRSEFRTVAAFWAYVNARRRGLVTIVGRKT